MALLFDIYTQIIIKMNLTYAYIFLAVAIILEVIGTSFLKDTNGFTKLYPSLFVLTAFFICIYLMSHTMKFIPVGITYATWSGLGIVAITIIAVFKYKQIPNIPTTIGLSLIIIGVIVVHLMNDINVK
jgi:small multidrug resistance pump